MPKSLCRAIGHGWREMTIKGWFCCERRGSGAYAVCPSCVRSRPNGALSCVCVKDIKVSRCLLSIEEESLSKEG
jgi:hypothetical protein